VVLSLDDLIERLGMLVCQPIFLLLQNIGWSQMLSFLPILSPFPLALSVSIVVEESNHLGPSSESRRLVLCKSIFVDLLLEILGKLPVFAGSVYRQAVLFENEIGRVVASGAVVGLLERILFLDVPLGHFWNMEIIVLTHN
jgi:hypothetical protein